MRVIPTVRSHHFQCWLVEVVSHRLKELLHSLSTCFSSWYISFPVHFTFHLPCFHLSVPLPYEDLVLWPVQNVTVWARHGLDLGTESWQCNRLPPIYKYYAHWPTEWSAFNLHSERKSLRVGQTELIKIMWLTEWLLISGLTQITRTNNILTAPLSIKTHSHGHNPKRIS